MRASRFFLFAAAFAYLLIGCHYHLEYLDDGETSYCAWRILSGAVPYKDFMLVCMPAHFYVLALWLKVFGAHLMVERVWQCLVWSGALLALYSVGRLALPAVFCLAGWLMGLVLVGRFSHLPGALPSTLFFGFWAVYLYLSAMPSERRGKIFFSGFFVGLAALFRQDIGFYTALSIFSVLAICHDPALRRRGDMRRYLGGLFAAVALPTAYFLSVTPFKELFFDLVYVPLRVYPAYSSLPYAALNEISEKTVYFYFAPLALIASFLFLLLGWHKPRNADKAPLFWPMALWTVLGTLFLSQMRFRADAAHLLPAYLAATPLFAFLMFCVHQRKRTVFLLPVLFLSVLFLVPGVRSKIMTLRSERVPVYLTAPRAEGVDLAPFNVAQAGEFSDYAKTLGYVRSVTAPGEKIFVGSSRHDRICYADPLFYFLSQRDSGTRYHEMYRGVAVTENVQREIIHELQQNDVRVVVLRRALDDRCSEPNGSSRAVGSRLLDDYLMSHYKPEKDFGGDKVLRRT